MKATWAIVVLIGVTFWYVMFQAVRWVARIGGGWGLLWLSVGLVGIFAGIAAAAWLRDRREDNEPWCDVPWDVRR